MSGFVRICLILLSFFSTACAQSPGSAAPALSGEKAMEHVRTQVAFGPRPPGSAALEKCRAYLIAQLEGYGYEVEKDSFEANTPYGPKKMTNLIARKKSGGSNIIALASHYDTKYFENIHFVGANDGGSSTGLLLELARVLAGRKSAFDYWFLFLDGEEAFVDWSLLSDGTYGSRHLAKRWQVEGTAPKVRALLLLDMIGDRNLNLQKDLNSTPWLMDLVWNAAMEGGFRDILAAAPTAIEDDHLPFMGVKISCADVIDLDYEPWHTAADTLDKISATSMERVGKLVLAVIPKLEQRLSGK
jgi:glutaminyl-peptide cyclotransferase